MMRLALLRCGNSLPSAGGILKHMTLRVFGIQRAELRQAASALAGILVVSAPWVRTPRTQTFRKWVDMEPLLQSYRARSHSNTVPLSRLLHPLPQILILIIPIFLCCYPNSLISYSHSLYPILCLLLTPSP